MSRLWRSRTLVNTLAQINNMKLETEGQFPEEYDYLNKLELAASQKENGSPEVTSTLKCSLGTLLNLLQSIQVRTVCLFPSPFRKENTFSWK